MSPMRVPISKRTGPLLAIFLAVWWLTAAFVEDAAAQGTPEACGTNTNGQLGNGTLANAFTLTPVSGLHGGVSTIAAGGIHGLALYSGGLYAWGYNAFGQLGNGTTTQSTTPVPVSILTSGVTAVTAGFGHSLAIQNGALYAWGYNDHGQVGNGTLVNVLTPTPIGSLSSEVTAIAGGVYHSLAIRGSAVYAWGLNIRGQLGNGTTTQSALPIAVPSLSSGVTTVAAGGEHSLAIQAGTVFSWGDNGAGEVGNGSTTNALVPVPLNEFAHAAGIAAGVDHSLVLQDGSVFAWGGNGYGQLGNGSTTGSNTPTQVDPADLHDIQAVAAGEYASYALASDGSLWVWGLNGNGQLGLGTTTVQFTTPQHLLPPTGYGFSAVDADGDGTFAVVTLALGPATIHAVSRPGNGHFILQASGVPNATYSVQASADLIGGGFTTIGTVTADATGAMQYDDAGAVGLSQRFYRITFP